MNILLADDHALIREGLEYSLTSLDNSYKCIHAFDACSVIEQLQSHGQVDVILLDLFMPGANGYELLNEIRLKYAAIPVIILSSTEDIVHIKKVLEHGASGFIPKSSDVKVILSAIQLVLSGGTYVPVGMLKSKPVNKTPPAIDNDFYLNIQQDITDKITSRQKDVLILMGYAMSNKEIAQELNISDHTIKVHVASIMRLFNAANRMEAVNMAKNYGIIMS